MSDSGSNVSKQTGLIIKALEKLLRPLVKLLISYQVTFPMLSELLKSIYVDVAQTDFKLEYKKVTDSRISVLTGVHRKDIKALRGAKHSRLEESGVVSLGTQLISVWLTDRRYLDKQGRAKPLPRMSRGERGTGFDSLVRTVGRQDIHPRSVLDDWLRLGVVELNDKGEVVLLNDAFIPKQGFEEKVFFLAQNIHDHLATVTHNIAGDAPSLLEQSVYYGELSGKSVEQLHAIARRMLTGVLKELDKKAKALKKMDHAEQGTNNQYRMNFGAYFYQERDGAIEDETNDVATNQ